MAGDDARLLRSAHLMVGDRGGVEDRPADVLEETVGKPRPKRRVSTGVEQLQNQTTVAPMLRLGMTDPHLDARTALSVLHAQHYTKLVRLAVALVDSEQSAEEVVQDAFLNVMRRWHSIEDVDAAAGYLRRAVVNGARDRLRRRKVRRAFHLPDAVPGDGPEDAAVLREEHREVLAVLRTLPPRQRECLVLRHFTGLSEADTAATLGISVAAAKSATHKGITAMRAALSNGDNA